MPDGIALTVINKSNDKNNSDILIYQKNVAQGFSEIAVAWQVIQYLGSGDRHPFLYSFEYQVDASDSYGNYTPRFPISPGQAYQMVRTTSGDVLQLYPPGADSPDDMDVRNNMPTGSIAANIYRSGKLLATKTAIVPGQKAVFIFKPTIFIGVVSQVEEGQVLDSAIVSTVNTEISLLGIQSADIVMTGGGSGPDAKPFEFSLQNVKIE